MGKIIKGGISYGGNGGSSDISYNDLEDKPSINNVELSGNKTTEDLGLVNWTALSLTQTVSTSAPTDFVFNNAEIKSNSTIDVYTDIFGYMPSNIVTTNGTCTVTMPSYSSAVSVTVKIYVIN